jgi:uncharacterized membrane protein
VVTPRCFRTFIWRKLASPSIPRAIDQFQNVFGVRNLAKEQMRAQRGCLVDFGAAIFYIEVDELL